MKQYTTPDQTAKLIELGFGKPKNEVKAEQAGDYAWYNSAYSIGELIEMLGYDLYSMHYLGMSWDVKSERIGTREVELIDALYDMCIKLKEEGVI